jgi:type III secretion system FlhB-like substrate exporter
MKNTPYQQAVALEYGKNKTPVVSAKGEGELARRIIAEAKRQGVYVSEDPRLLAMLSRLDVGQEIRVIRQCHGHSPMMLRSGGAYLMLRKRDADKILVRHL